MCTGTLGHRGVILCVSVWVGVDEGCVVTVETETESERERERERKKERENPTKRRGRCQEEWSQQLITGSYRVADLPIDSVRLLMIFVSCA